MEVKISIGKVSLSAVVSKDDAQKLIRELFAELDGAVEPKKRGRRKGVKVAAKKIPVTARMGRPPKAKTVVSVAAVAKPKAPRNANVAQKPMQKPEAPKE